VAKAGCANDAANQLPLLAPRRSRRRIVVEGMRKDRHDIGKWSTIETRK
jgi:hypothetical protein